MLAWKNKSGLPSEFSHVFNFIETSYYEVTSPEPHTSFWRPMFVDASSTKAMFSLVVSIYAFSRYQIIHLGYRYHIFMWKRRVILSGKIPK
jgi:hypothetical protein